MAALERAACARGRAVFADREAFRDRPAARDRAVALVALVAFLALFFTRFRPAALGRRAPWRAVADFALAALGDLARAARGFAGAGSAGIVDEPATETGGLSGD